MLIMNAYRMTVQCWQVNLQSICPKGNKGNGFDSHWEKGPKKSI